MCVQYHASTSRKYRDATTAMQQKAHELLMLCQVILPARAGAGSMPPASANPDDTQEWVTGLLDEMAHAVDTALDRHKHVQPVEAIPSVTHPHAAAYSLHGDKRSKGLTAAALAGMPKPQEQFAQRVDNSTAPFVHWAPHLKGIASRGPPPPPSTPPLAVTSQAEAVPAAVHTPNGQEAAWGDSWQSTSAAAAVPEGHPLKHELDTLTYLPWQLQASDPIPPRPLDSAPVQWVDTPDALQAMVAALSACTHIAIDLEHHSYRSFQGITCLMQVSSRDQDWLVDTLALRAHLGPALAAQLANPACVKVLHGSDHDILWLQRDFHLYIVNTFDTGQAARVLSLPSASLAYLLEHYCGVATDKRFQLADWRVRPLSDEMLAYARTDTHYLLYLHDRLKQQLHELGDKVPPSLAVPLPDKAVTSCPPPPAMAVVLERSRRICGQLYAKEECSPAVAQQLLLRWQETLAGVQQAVFTALLLWRDQVCREEDEGTGYVLPRAQLLTLAKSMPGTAKEVLRLAGKASEPLRRRVQEVVACITQAKASVLNPGPASGSSGLGTAQQVAANGAPSAATQAAAASAGAPVVASTQVPGLQPAPVKKMQRKGTQQAGSPAPAVQPVLEAQPVVAAPLLANGEGADAALASTADAPTMGAVAPLQAQGPPTQPLQQQGPAGASVRRPMVKKGSAFASTLISVRAGMQQTAAGVQPGAGTGATTLGARAQDALQPDVAAQVVSRLHASLALPFAMQLPTPSAAAPGAAANGDVAGADQAQGAAASSGTLQGDGEQLASQTDMEPSELQEGQAQGEVEADDMACDEEEAQGHRGDAVGLPALEFVPTSMKELLKLERAKLKRAADSGGPASGAPAPRLAKAPKYTTDLAAGAASNAAQSASAAVEAKVRTLFGEEDSDSEGDSDSEQEVAAEQQGAQVADPQLAKQFSKARASAAQAHMQSGRGRRGHRDSGRSAAGRGAGGRGRGSRQPAFNPYHIPDEHLVKAGKRTTVMPRSGNRVATLK